MTTRTRALCAAAVLAAASAAAAGAALYRIESSSIDGGGTTVSDGTHTLLGIAGQPDAAVMTDGAYTLEGGFLSRDTGPGDAFVVR
jgi:predicted porin